MPESGGLRKRPVGSKRAPRANFMERQTPDSGSDLLSTLLGEVRGLLAALQELGWKDLRPWGEFFARFKAPREWSLTALDERVTTNVLHYRGNYAAILSGSLLVSIISSFSVLVALVLSLVLIVYLFPSGKDNRVVVIAGREPDRAERMAVAVIGVSCLLGFSGAVYSILYSLGLALLGCLVHAIFRPRNPQSKLNRLSEEVKVSGSAAVEAERLKEMLALKYSRQKEETDEMQRRRDELEQQMSKMNLSEAQKKSYREELGRMEAHTMRESRRRLTTDDFDSLAIIGRGAFGEVQQQCLRN